MVIASVTLFKLEKWNNVCLEMGKNFIEGKRKLSVRYDHCKYIYKFLAICQTNTYVIKLTLSKTIVFHFFFFKCHQVHWASTIRNYIAKYIAKLYLSKRLLSSPPPSIL